MKFPGFEDPFPWPKELPAPQKKMLFFHPKMTVPFVLREWSNDADCETILRSAKPSLVAVMKAHSAIPQADPDEASVCVVPMYAAPVGLLVSHWGHNCDPDDRGWLIQGFFAPDLKTYVLRAKQLAALVWPKAGPGIEAMMDSLLTSASTRGLN